MKQHLTIWNRIIRSGFALSLALPLGILAADSSLSWQALSNRWGYGSVPEVRAAAEQGIPNAQAFLGWMYDNGVGVERSREQAKRWTRKAAEQGYAYAQYYMGVMAEFQWDQLQGQSIPGNYQVAAEWFEKAAAQGHVEAMFHLGELYYYGHLGHNGQQAVRWFRQAAQKGNDEAVMQLGQLYRDNLEDLPADLAESARWYRLAAAKNNAEAQYQLGLVLLEGLHGQTNWTEAEYWLKRAADNGQTQAAFKLASLHPAKSGSPASNLSRQELELAAYRADGIVRLALGIDYEEGLGGKPDVQRAAGAYFRVLNLGPRKDAPEAVRRLINLYARGQLKPATRTSPSSFGELDGSMSYFFALAPQNQKKLADYFESYRDSITSARAMFQVGEMYYHGTILAEDWAKAVEWFTRGAENGSPDSQNRLGEMWAAGVDGAPDPVEGVRWYRKAAQQGCAAAQLNLGRALALGEGVENNPVEAWAWLSLAANQGAAGTNELLRAIQGKLTPEQLESAKKRMEEISGKMTSSPATVAPGNHRVQ